MPKVYWEQHEITGDIPVYNLTYNITESALAVTVRGDQHIGVKGVNIDEMIVANKKVQDQYRGHLLVLDTGDLVENGLKSSIGHNYDLDIADPDKQIEKALEVQTILDKHLYGDELYDNMSHITKKSHKYAKHVYVLGNHEYRDRKESGKWLNKSLCTKGILDGGVKCILKVTVKNTKTNSESTYKILLAHRLGSGSVGSAGMLKAFKTVAAQHDDIDVIVCGHYHRAFMQADYKYDANGKKRKILYVANPSPVNFSEYSEWNGYAPSGAGYYINFFLPAAKHEHPYGSI